MSAPDAIGRAACVGGGVIGAGWAARLVLNGVDVSVCDPHPDAGRIVHEVLANARRIYGRMCGSARPAEGALTVTGDIARAVAGASLVQESVPERLDLKREVLAAIDATAAPDALIASSTSGLLPTRMQAGLIHPERVLVGHPFNPVYLLPLVEVVAGEQTAPDAVSRARAIYAALGMHPVVIAKEIDAFVGDRLQEALWREALWLVHDGIATVEEIDDVMRYSFGLRWAQMGVFQVYRTAGGEAGMRHFMQQFGPCLKWPWTRLTDVPELDDAFLDRIAEQSDAQSGGLDVRALERIRDDNLLAILQALKTHDGGAGWGAGGLQRDYEAALQQRAPATRGDEDVPMRSLRAIVDTTWVDYNGHMTEHRYVQVFGDATDVVLHRIGADLGYVAAGHSYFTVETHVIHVGEAHAGDELIVMTQILSADDKRLHLHHRMLHAQSGTLLASSEQLLLHVDTRAARACAVTGTVRERLMALCEAHAGLPAPAAVGRHVGAPR